MVHNKCIQYTPFKEELTKAIDKCYPKERGDTFISSKILLYEMEDNTDKYPKYSELKTKQRKKQIITHICVNLFKWDHWKKPSGASSPYSVYRREV